MCIILICTAEEVLGLFKQVLKKCFFFSFQTGLDFIQTKMGVVLIFTAQEVLPSVAPVAPPPSVAPVGEVRTGRFGVTTYIQDVNVGALPLSRKTSRDMTPLSDKVSPTNLESQQKMAPTNLDSSEIVPQNIQDSREIPLNIPEISQKSPESSSEVPQKIQESPEILQDIQASLIRPPDTLKTPPNSRQSREGSEKSEETSYEKTLQMELLMGHGEIPAELNSSVESQGDAGCSVSRIISSYCFYSQICCFIVTNFATFIATF